jgi:L-arabinose isomerase
VARTTVVGHVSDSAVSGRIGTWSRAAAGYAASRSLKLARFGDNMRFVAVTEGDKTEAEHVFGVQVNTWGVNELADAVSQASDSDVDALVAEYEELYDVVPELRRGGDRHQSLRDGAAIELGLRSFLEEGGFGAFTTNFEDLGALKQLPGLAVQRLMAEGYGFGAEGDWKTACLVRAVKVMANGLPGGSSFMEDYTYHLDPKGAKVLGAHMLEVCPTIAQGKPTLEVHPLSIGGKADPARLVFTAAPGPGLCAAVIDLGNRFRLVVNAVEVVSPDAPLPRLPVARALWRPEPDLKTAAAAWIHAGSSHHTAFSLAVTPEHLRDFADMAGIEFVLIDRETRLPQLLKELRWNEACY